MTEFNIDKVKKGSPVSCKYLEEMGIDAKAKYLGDFYPKGKVHCYYLFNIALKGGIPTYIVVDEHGKARNLTTLERVDPKFNLYLVEPEIVEFSIDLVKEGWTICDRNGHEYEIIYVNPNFQKAFSDCFIVKDSIGCLFCINSVGYVDRYPELGILKIKMEKSKTKYMGYFRINKEKIVFTTESYESLNELSKNHPTLTAPLPIYKTY